MLPLHCFIVYILKSIKYYFNRLSLFFISHLLFLFQSVFSKGAGSQLVHQSLFTQPAVSSQWGMLDEQARQLLNQHEQDTMTYYLTQYQESHINVKQVVMALMQLFNTHAKVGVGVVGQ